MEERIQENLKFVYERVDQFWSLVHEDGDMKVKNSEKKKNLFSGPATYNNSIQIYRRDLEEGGVVLDPLKAQHTIPVSEERAREDSL